MREDSTVFGVLASSTPPLPGARAVEASDESPHRCFGFLAAVAIGQAAKSSKSTDSEEWEAHVISYGKQVRKSFKITLHAHVCICPLSSSSFPKSMLFHYVAYKSDLLQGGEGTKPL